MKTNTALNAFDLNTPVNTCTQAEYDLLQQEGKLKAGELYYIVDKKDLGIAVGSSGFVDSTCYGYINKDYQQDGIEIENIYNTETIYKAVFESLCRNNPEEREKWALLLKLNEYNYTLTVTQIQSERLKVEQ